MTKRLCAAYTPAWKAEDADHRALLPYALLSVVCMAQYERTHQLPWLNGALKLHDFLAAAWQPGQELLTCVAAAAAVERELIAVRTLAVQQGVVP